jgi:hypothetical protein
MSKTNQTNTPNTVGEERCRDLMVQFLAELFQQTGAPAQQEHFQSALQTYCDNLRPWLESQDGPSQPRAVFSILEEYTIDATGDNVTVVLSPEGDALFRAWLRRNKTWSDAGLNTVHAWSN